MALLPFYAGLRLGETVALDLDDIQLSARKGLIIVRAGKGSRSREIPVHPTLRADLTLWINDERPDWPGADTSPALLLNRRGTRLSARGAHDIINAIADAARLQDDFTSHVLRHTFGTTLVRQGHDLILVAELLGHARLDTVRTYSLPTDTDRQKAIDSLLTDRWPAPTTPYGGFPAYPGRTRSTPRSTTGSYDHCSRPTDHPPHSPSDRPYAPSTTPSTTTSTTPG
jgi:integrase/recombinase XerC